MEPPKGYWQAIEDTENPYLGEKHPMEQALDAMEEMFKLMAAVEAEWGSRPDFAEAQAEAKEE